MKILNKIYAKVSFIKIGVKRKPEIIITSENYQFHFM